MTDERRSGNDRRANLSVLRGELEQEYNCQVEGKPCQRWCGANPCLTELGDMTIRMMRKAEQAADWSSRAEIAERELAQYQAKHAAIMREADRRYDEQTAELTQAQKENAELGHLS